MQNSRVWALAAGGGVGVVRYDNTAVNQTGGTRRGGSQVCLRMDGITSVFKRVLRSDVGHECTDTQTDMCT